MKLLVKSAKHVKDGQGQKGPWSLFSFEDSEGKRYSTFWTRIVNFVGQEIVGEVTIKEEQGTDKDGNQRVYTNRSFRPDPAWEKSAQPSLTKASTIPQGKNDDRIAELAIIKTAGDMAGRIFSTETAKDWTPVRIGNVFTSCANSILHNLLHIRQTITTVNAGKNPIHPDTYDNKKKLADAVKEGETIFQGKVVSETPAPEGE